MARSSSRRDRAGASFALLLVVGALLTPAAALGHAELVSATPADGATVASPPAEIVLLFSEDLDPGRSTIRLVDAAGTVIAEGGRVDPGNDARTMRLALPTPPPPGSYTIRWTSFSTEDDEQARGTTTFTIAAPTPPPTTPATPSAEPVPSAGASIMAPSPSTTASPTPTSDPTSAPTADALVPIVAALVVLAALGAWLLRGRARRSA